MDSRTSFGIIIVIMGLVGMWFLVTKSKQIMAAFAPAPAPAASTAANPLGGQVGAAVPDPSNAAGGSWNVGPSQPTATPSISYGVSIGGDGLAIEPLGGVRVLG